MKEKKEKVKILKNLDKPLLIATIILIIFGTLSIVSASANESISRYGTSIYKYFYRHIGMISIGIIGSIIIHRVHSKWYRAVGALTWVTVLGFLISLFFLGKDHRGSLNWLTIGGITIQPSEFAKPIIILSLACLFDAASKLLKEGKLGKANFTWLWFIIGIIIPGIVIIQGDLGTGFIITAISGIMFLAGPLDKKTKIKHISSLAVVGVLALSLFGLGRGYLLTAEQKERITDFYNPCSKYEDSGYQICNCFIAINDGGLTGLGISKSKQKYSYIPEAYTDSIFAIVIEENGLLIGLAVIFIYFFMIWRILKISVKTKSIKGRYIAFGVAIYLFMHVLLNLGGLLGLLPLTGVPLPLITYGGSFTISFIAAIALVQRVNIEASMDKTAKKRI